jgi:hypothetical protein
LAARDVRAGFSPLRQRTLQNESVTRWRYGSMTIKAKRQRALDEQRAWIDKCGGDSAGYVANYHGKHNRTVDDALAIYRADFATLQNLERALARCR